MSQEKGESYLDDLLKEMESNPADYKNYAKKSDTINTSTGQTDEIFEDFFSDENLSEIDFDSEAELDWDDITVDDFDDMENEFPEFALEENLNAGEPEPVLEESLNAGEPEPVLEDGLNVGEPELILEESLNTGEPEPALEESLNAEEPAFAEEESLEEPLALLEEESSLEEAPVALEEEAGLEEPLDNLVENLLDNLDDTGSLGEITQIENIEPEINTEEMETDNMDDLDALMNSLTQEDTEAGKDENGGADDLLSLLSDTDFEAIGKEKETSDADDDIFSLDAMLEDLGGLEDSGDSADENTEPPELSLETDTALDASFEDALASLQEDKEEGKEQKNKKGKKKEKETETEKSIFQRLFGNVHDDKAQKQKEKAVKAKEEKEKKKKPKKTKEEKEEEKKLKAQEKKEKQEASKKIKEAKKKEKEELKRKKKEAEAAEEEVDEGRINRVGATIVFAFFGIVAAFCILGSQSFSYRRCIAKATEFFGVQQYNEAYEEVRGVDVKEDDKEIYDKIMTVMYVNKQLNSYNNYYNLKMYPEALDSLLKGLKRYDEYSMEAKELGIQSDMDYVKNQILGELKEMYQMSEADAYRLINADSQEDYSRLVIEKAGTE